MENLQQLLSRKLTGDDKPSVAKSDFLLREESQLLVRLLVLLAELDVVCPHDLQVMFSN